MASMGGASGGSYPPHDLRGQGGGNRDSLRLPNEGLSHAEYETQIEHEMDDTAHGKQPSVLERFKRWFSARF